jgi:iron complex transport system substrate-binding protein
MFNVFIRLCAVALLLSSAATAQVVVTDALERTVTLEATPERIVVAGRGTFMVVNAVQAFPAAAERLVAYSRTGQFSEEFARLVFDHVDGMVQLEPGAAAEQIAPLQPDLVILKSTARAVGESLITIGIPVVYVDLETPEQYSRDLNTLGAVLGTPERAAELVAYFDDVVRRVEAAVAGADRPRVLLVNYDVRGGEIAFRVPPDLWIQTEMVSLAGGEPIWLGSALEGGWQTVSLEQIAAWNPEVVIVVDYFNPEGEALSAIYGSPLWGSLQAVQNRRVFEFPADHYNWAQPDVRWPLGLLWLANVLQGVDFDLRVEIHRFYNTLYGLDDATIQSAILPRLRALSLD